MQKILNISKLNPAMLKKMAHNSQAGFISGKPGWFNMGMPTKVSSPSIELEVALQLPLLLTSTSGHSQGWVGMQAIILARPLLVPLQLIPQREGGAPGNPCLDKICAVPCCLCRQLCTNLSHHPKSQDRGIQAHVPTRPLSTLDPSHLAPLLP